MRLPRACVPLRCMPPTKTGGSICTARMLLLVVGDSGDVFDSLPRPVDAQPSTDAATPLAIAVSPSVDRAEWDATLAKLDGSVFNSCAWADFRVARDGGKPLYVRWTAPDTGETFALAIGMQAPDPATLRGRLASRLEFESAPATRRPDADHLSPLVRWARADGSIVEIRCGSFDSTWTPPPPRDRQDRLEFLVPAGDEAALLKQMRKGARSSIKRGQRLGLKVVRRDDAGGAQAFAELHLATLRRLREEGRLQESIRDEENVSSQLGVLIERGAGRVYLAGYEDEVVAGCFFGCFGRSLYYLLSG